MADCGKRLITSRAIALYSFAVSLAATDASVMLVPRNTPALLCVTNGNYYQMEKLTFEQLPEAVASILEKVSHIEQLLVGKSDDIQTLKEMLTTQEAAEFMGVSLSSIYKMSHRMEVPIYKPNGKKSLF